MIMMAQVLIFLIFLTHFAWILVVSIGSFLAVSGRLFKTPKLETTYLFVAAITVLNRLLSQQCWLTMAETSLRSYVSGEHVQFGFIEHYLGTLDVHIEGGVLFFVGAVWIGIGLLAIAIRHLISYRYRVSGSLQEAR